VGTTPDTRIPDTTAADTPAPDTIVPRWEWRTFGGDLAEASARLAAAGAGEVQRTHEVYLLSALNDASVKVRAGLLDIKRLEEVDGDGLERWRPILKAPFPLPAETVAEVFDCLGAPIPELTRADYGLEQLLAELIAPAPDLRALQVHKTRTRVRFEGFAAEVTEVVADGRRVRTLAVESEDRAAVVAALRRLGLEGVPNQAYPPALKALIGMTGEGGGAGTRYAAIDVGTNSVKLHLAERDEAGRWTPVLDRVEVTRLGEGLRERGELGRSAQARTIDVIRALADAAWGAGAVQTLMVGTAGLRFARNGQAFVDAVREACGLSIEVISGEEEARLAYLAAAQSLGIPAGSLVVFDSGGGSTQLSIGRDGRVEDRFSLPLGAVRLTEQFGLAAAVSAETITAALDAIAGELGRLDALGRPETLVGMGGAVTNLAAVSLGMTEYEPDRIQGFELTRAEVEGQIARYAALDSTGRCDIPGLQPGRAEVILAGALIVLSLLRKLDRDQLRVSDRGLRHGVLMDRFPG
jgi:exopolyphosphatase/guanosine-5'-triphosphate,3'-diphosphate pyrophosphatase